MNYIENYRKCYLIRLFEKQVEKEFSFGKLRGTTHGCIGQEVIPVFVMDFIDKDIDYVVGTHRCHGQVLAYTGDVYRLACEMMGKKDGFVYGIGGSQHIKVKKYLTNGVTGGMATVGTGIALGIKKTKKESIVISFLGDGGFNEGYVQESLNLASVLGLPIVYICENNHFAMSTPTKFYSSGSFEKRVKALDMEYILSTTDNLEKLYSDIEKGFYYVRQQRKPCFIDIQTARLCGHSKSDPMDYMSSNEKQKNIENDPLIWLEHQLSDKEIRKIQREVSEEISLYFNKANQCEELNV